MEYRPVPISDRPFSACLAPWYVGAAPAPAELNQLAPISLEQMDAVALLDRTDTKYLLSAARLPALLASLRADYQVLDLAGARLSPYQTLYFDTPDFALYRRHQAGRRRRCKIRSRRYAATGRSFFEVKFKTGPAHTRKVRLETAGPASRLTPELAGQLAAWGAPVDVEHLAPVLANTFTRVTLVGRRAPERVTLDLDLRFSRDLGGAAGPRALALPGLMVAEVKQAGRPRDSAFAQSLRAARLQPLSFSKYCLGAALLYPELPRHHFQATLKQISRLLEAAVYVH